MNHENALLRPDEVTRMLRISNTTLARWRQNGKGPAFIRLGYNRVVYRRSDVERWLIERKES